MYLLGTILSHDPLPFCSQCFWQRECVGDIDSKRVTAPVPILMRAGVPRPPILSYLEEKRMTATSSASFNQHHDSLCKPEQVIFLCVCLNQIIPQLLCHITRQVYFSDTDLQGFCKEQTNYVISPMCHSKEKGLG